MTQEFVKRFTEVYNPGGTLFPAAHAPGAVTTVWLDMANQQRLVFLIAVGTIAKGATLDFRAYQATDATGAGATAAWKTVDWGNEFTLLYPIDQLTDVDSDSLIAVEIRAEQLSPGYRFVQAQLTVGGGGGTVEYCVIPLRGTSNFTQVPTTEWTQIVIEAGYP